MPIFVIAGCSWGALGPPAQTQGTAGPASSFHRVCLGTDWACDWAQSQHCHPSRPLQTGPSMATPFPTWAPKAPGLESFSFISGSPFPWSRTGSKGLSQVSVWCG